MNKRFLVALMALVFFHFQGYVCGEIPTLISPENGAVLDNGCNDHSNKCVWDFDWSDVSGATKYHLYVIGNTAIYPVINNSNLSTSDFHSEDFGYIATHNLYNWKWKVRAYVNGSWSDWSEERSFDVEPLNADCVAIPLLISPRSGAVLDNGCDDHSNKCVWDFDWTDVNGASKYHLYVIGNTAIYPVINNSNLSTSDFHFENYGYIAEKNLYNWKWKVRAYVNGNWSDWSEERNFDVESLNVDCNGIYTLIAPENGAVLDNGCKGSYNKIVWDFDWADVNGATKYHLYVIGNTAMNPVIDNSSLSTSDYHRESTGYIISRYLYNWKWRVRAYVDGDWLGWSEERSFDVEPLNTDCTPVIKLNKSYLNFGAIPSGPITSSQSFTISNSGAGSLSWSISESAGWLNPTPNSGTGSGTVTVSVNPTGLAAGTYIEKIRVSDSKASNSPQTLTVTLNVYNSGATSVPFGEFATPVHGSTVRSSIPVTGWVLDDLEVKHVKIYRNPVSGEGSGLIYIGDGVFVEGARPDVEQAYPDYPMNYKAGWGYMMLTNFLPNGGNGTFIIYAIAADIEGNQETLGTKTITCDNANAVKPFGAIDTPTQGGTASGSGFVNWGWVLTPRPNSIPTDGSTINVYVDGVYLGHPTYNIYRPDIAGLFPGLANSDGAAGYFYLDTTAYENGVHSIQWTAADNAGNTDGIGSRYFTIQNMDNGSTQCKNTTQGTLLSNKINLAGQSEDHYEPIYVKTGYNTFKKPQEIYPDVNGYLNVKVNELGRVEIHFAAPITNISSLPTGSTLDNKQGIFYWGIGPGFYGDYEIEFFDMTSYSIKKVVIHVE